MEYSAIKVACLAAGIWLAVLPVWAEQKPNDRFVEMQVTSPVTYPNTGTENPVSILGFIKDFYIIEYKYPGRPIRILGLKLETADGLVYRAHLAPPGYFSDQSWHLSVGDVITLRGAFVRLNQGLALIADKISWQGKQLRLRDRQGLPIWSYSPDIGTFSRNLIDAGLR